MCPIGHFKWWSFKLRLITAWLRVPPSLSTRPEKLVWHGSSTVGIRLTTNYCEAWRTGDVAVMGQAALLQTGRLLGQHTRSCSQHYIVLCIENTYVVNTQAGRSWGPHIRGQVCQIETLAHTDLSPHTHTSTPTLLLSLPAVRNQMFVLPSATGFSASWQQTIIPSRGFSISFKICIKAQENTQTVSGQFNSVISCSIMDEVINSSSSVAFLLSLPCFNPRITKKEKNIYSQNKKKCMIFFFQSKMTFLVHRVCLAVNVVWPSDSLKAVRFILRRMFHCVLASEEEISVNLCGVNAERLFCLIDLLGVYVHINTVCVWCLFCFLLSWDAAFLSQYQHLDWR